MELAVPGGHQFDCSSVTSLIVVSSQFHAEWTCSRMKSSLVIEQRQGGRRGRWQAT